MNKRLILKQWIEKRLFGKSGKSVVRGDKARVMVFAPHQDDETLGCGGTICQKIRDGAQAQVVYLTDGGWESRNSAGDFLSTDELTRLRKNEAIAACRILGITEENIHFLNFPDGELSQHFNAAVDQLTRLVAHFKPDEAYVPYSFDGHPDHEATTRALWAALARASCSATVYEFPVWFWYRWPFREIGLRKMLKSGMLMKDLAVLLKGLIRFRHRMDISGVLETKRQALHAHKSQVEGEYGPYKRGSLYEVADGEWIKYFFHNNEIFWRRKAR